MSPSSNKETNMEVPASAITSRIKIQQGTTKKLLNEPKIVSGEIKSLANLIDGFLLLNLYS